LSEDFGLREGVPETLAAFQRGYNEQRLHSRLEYRTSATLSADEVDAMPS